MGKDDRPSFCRDLYERVKDILFTTSLMHISEEEFMNDLMIF